MSVESPRSKRPSLLLFERKVSNVALAVACGYVFANAHRDRREFIDRLHHDTEGRNIEQYPKGMTMGMKDKISNKLQDLKGRGKEAVGSAVGNKDLATKGKVDQTKAGLKDAGENVKDAASNVTDALKNH
jgi:uncharacterized protein YjbJ (UPF0337 family)